MKKVLTAVLALSFLSASAQSSDAATATDSWSAFWGKLRMKIEQLTPQKRLGATTAVGGVRGSAVEVSDVYWKGESKPQSIDAEELAAFQKAIGLVEAEQKEQAQLAFDDFLKSYPDSTLKLDAQQAVERLLASR